MSCPGCGDPACCGACAGPAARAPLRRGPGRSSLAWRIDDRRGFAQRILRALPGAGAPGRPLAGLSARGTDDPAIALVDAAATVLDVLAFYQARMADEGFLGTAREAFSLAALARAVGHEPAPGVAAETPLAFTLEEPPPGAPPPPGAVLPEVTTIPAGTRVQSIPGPGETPQIFETVETIEARRAWNRLRPLAGRPQTLALRAGMAGLWLYDLEGGLDTVAGAVAVAADTLRPLDVAPTLAALGGAAIRVIEVDSLWLPGTGLGFRRGELLLAAGAAGGAVQALVLALAGVVEDAARGLTRLDLRAAPKGPPPWSKAKLAQSYSPGGIAASPFLIAQAGAMSAGFYGATLASLGFAAGVFDQLYLATILPKAPDPGPGQPGLFRFRERAGFFGAGAPRYVTLTDDGKAAFGDYDKNPPSVWEDSRGTALGTGKVLLDRTTEAAETGAWTLLSAPGQAPAAYRIAAAAAEAASDFALSGRVTALDLRNPDGTGVTTPAGFRFRTTTAHLGATRLALAALPIVDDIAAGTEDLLVEGDHLALPPGRRLILEGTTPEGLAAVEAIGLVAPLKLGRNTLLRFDRPTTHAYARASLGVLGNVARATHGETVREVLGHGDPGAANQSFRLARSPLTHTAEGMSGRRAALTVRVDGVAWRETFALTDAGPGAPVFMLRRDAEGRTRVTFGDGAEGARLPFGRDTVVATYRTGLGPDGAVKPGALAMLIDRPLAVRGVRNPLPATGAEAPEAPEATRAAVPAGLRALGRVVALADVAAFAEAYGGVGQARAEEIWAGPRRLVVLTLADAEGASPAEGSPLLEALGKALARVADPALAVRILGYAPRPFFATARVRPRPDRDAEAVRGAAEAAFAAALAPQARRIAAPITAAQLLATLAAVPGVAEAVLARLGPDEAPGAAPPAAILPALGARLSGGAIAPAELLVPAAAVVELA